MRWAKCGRWVAALGLAAALGAPGFSDDQTKEKGRWAGLLNVNVMVETYTQFLVRRYDLTEEQGAYTKQLLTQRAADFMSAHGDEVNSLMEGLFDARAGGDITQDELVAWGQRAMPIFEEAKRLIVAGNDEWRNILSDEQKRIHDEDLVQMNENFAHTHAQLDRIVTGEMTVDEFRKPQRNSSTGRRPGAGARAGGRNRRATGATPPAAPPAPQAEGAVPVPSDPDREVPQPAESSPDGDAPEAVVNTKVTPPGLDSSRGDAPRDVPAPEPGGAPPPAEDRPVLEPPPGAAAVQPPRTPQPDDAREREMEGRDDRPEQPEPAITPRPRPEAPGQPNGEISRPGGGRRDKDAGGGKTKAEPESRWEQYTREFIERYKLDPGQTQKALDILKDCKEQAASVLRSKAAQIEALDKRIEALKGATGGDAKERGKAMTELTETRGKLVEPLDRIFEKQLKPRLEKLPTRAQRQAAEAAKAKSKAGADGGKRKNDAGGKKEGD